MAKMQPLKLPDTKKLIPMQHKNFIDHPTNNMSGDQSSMVDNMMRVPRRAVKNLTSGASGSAFYQMVDAFKKLPKRFGL